MSGRDAIDSVELALDILKCSQKELADRLGVSPTQISKWKKGEYISSEMEGKIQKLTKIGDLQPSFVRWAGSVDAARKWEKLFKELAELAEDGAESGYDTYPLKDEMGLLSWHTVTTLNELGVEWPKNFPKKLDFEDVDERWEVIESDPYAALVYNIYKSLTDVYGFYAAYVDELLNNNDLNLSNTPADNIEPCLMALAAAKLDVDAKFAPKLSAFSRGIRNDYTKWLTLVKNKAFQAGVPLRAELLDMVHGTHDELGHEAEAEALGFNASRLHPDIYMNELLTGMRIIHQVLPVIMKKLRISKKEFKLDASELRNDHSRFAAEDYD